MEAMMPPESSAAFLEIKIHYVKLFKEYNIINCTIHFKGWGGDIIHACISPITRANFSTNEPRVLSFCAKYLPYLVNSKESDRHRFH